MKPHRKEEKAKLAQSFQFSTQKPVVLDTSAAINLVSSGFAEEILKAIPNDFLLPETVFDELAEGREKGWPHADAIDALHSSRLFESKAMDDSALQIFESLVIGRGKDTLDDGEAATLAIASSSNCLAILDDRKAIRVGNERFPSTELRASVDLFAHAAVFQSIGNDKVSEAVFSALRHARMRVQTHHLNWVMELIGGERAESCSSLFRHLQRLSS